MLREACRDEGKPQVNVVPKAGRGVTRLLYEASSKRLWMAMDPDGQTGAGTSLPEAHVGSRGVSGITVSHCCVLWDYLLMCIYPQPLASTEIHTWLR